MKRTLFIILAVYTLSAVSQDWKYRRTFSDEELPSNKPTKVETEETKKPTIICAPITPCGWSTYDERTHKITLEIKNTYCVCGSGLTCEISVDDTVGSVFIKKCQVPGPSSIITTFSGI